jgi:hypothetical protein
MEEPPLYVRYGRGQRSLVCPSVSTSPTYSTVRRHSDSHYPSGLSPLQYAKVLPHDFHVSCRTIMNREGRCPKAKWLAIPRKQNKKSHASRLTREMRGTVTTVQ